MEVDKSLGEYEHVSLVKHLREELVVGVRGDESDAESALNDGEDLGGARVGVGRVQTVGAEVDAGYGDAEGVEAGELRRADQSHVGADLVHGVSRLVETREEEIFGGGEVWVLAHQPIYEYCTKRRRKQLLSNANFGSGINVAEMKFSYSLVIVGSL